MSSVQERHLFQSGEGWDDQADAPVVLRKRVKDSAEMDITPMIDITFLLLIFFLVCSTMDQQNTVPLPEARFGTGVSDRNATILTVADKGEGKAVVYLGDGTGGAPLTADPDSRDAAITEAVEQGLQNGKKVVLIKAAGVLKEGEVARIEAAAGEVEGVRLFHAVVEER